MSDNKETYVEVKKQLAPLLVERSALPDAEELFLRVQRPALNATKRFRRLILSWLKTGEKGSLSAFF